MKVSEKMLKIKVIVHRMAYTTPLYTCTYATHYFITIHHWIGPAIHVLQNIIIMKWGGIFVIPACGVDTQCMNCCCRF